ncbi:MAG: hypothetical protein ACUVUH_07615 [bacterium]
MLKFCYLTLLSSALSSVLSAGNDKESPIQEAPYVFIDYEIIDMDFIKTEIPYVNYVIDRRDADIYILITTQITAGKGTEFTLFFNGQKNFIGMNDTIRYVSLKSDSDDTIRRELAKRLKLGLVRYLTKTPIAEKLSINLIEKKVTITPKDPWHNWVFNIGLNGFFNGQQKLNFNSLNATLSINKILRDWKFLNDLSYSYTYNIYKLNDTTITNESKSYSGLTNPIIGLNNHFSIGGYLSFYSSTYQNILLSSGIAPAIEYNIFPYEESSSRKLTVLYDIGYTYYEYYEMTIYDKLKERLFKESASLGIDIKQRWGSLDITLKASHYFHDFKKNRVTLYTYIALPVLKGLSFNIFSHVSMIHDQLSLPKRELTEQEIILQKKLIATQYSYYLSIGLSYTFGSIYSNIVNPRFVN